MHRVKYEGPFFFLFSTFTINNSPPYKNPRSAQWRFYGGAWEGNAPPPVLLIAPPPPLFCLLSQIFSIAGLSQLQFKVPSQIFQLQACLSYSLKQAYEAKRCRSPRYSARVGDSK